MIDLAEKAGPFPPETASPKEVWYPSINLDKDEDISLPDEGEFTVKFKVKSRTVEEREGKKKYHCNIELRKITKVKGEKCCGTDEYKGRGDVLDKLRDMVMSESESE